MKKKFSIVIPVLNENENLLILVKMIRKNLKNLNYEIIFVDDGSEDGSNKILYLLSKKYKNIKFIIRKDKEKDLSQSCYEGIKKSVNDIILIMDGDMQHHPKNIRKMLKEYYKDKKINMIIAVREFDKKIYGMNFLRIFFSKILILFISIFFGKKTLDPMSGFFLFEKKFFMKNRKYYYLKGYKILADILYNSKTELVLKDVPIKFKKRIYGYSKMNIKILIILLLFLIKNFFKKFDFTKLTYL